MASKPLPLPLIHFSPSTFYKLPTIHGVMHHVHLHRPSTRFAALTSSWRSKVFDFVGYCAEQCRLNILPPAAIANMDETAIWADMPGNTTVEKIGATSVPLLTTGHEKERIVVCLSALACGKKLKPFIVFKGKRFPNELNNIQVPSLCSLQMVG